MKQSAPVVGLLIALVAYVAFSSVRAVWLHASLDVRHTSDYLLFLYLPTLIAMSAGWPAALWRDYYRDTGAETADKPKASWLREPFRPLGSRAALKIAVLHNISTLASCIPICISPALVYARTANAIGIAFIPLFAAVLSGNLKRKWFPCSVLLLGCVLLSWQEIRKPFMQSGNIAAVGIVVAMLGGLFSAVNIILARKLNDMGIGADGVFVRRYWLLLVVAAGWSLVFHCVSEEGFTWGLSTSCWEVLLVGVIGILAPSYAYLRVVAASNTMISAFAVPLIPITVFIIEIVRHGRTAAFPYIAAVGVCLVSAGVFAGMRRPAARQATIAGEPLRGPTKKPIMNGVSIPTSSEYSTLP